MTRLPSGNSLDAAGEIFLMINSRRLKWRPPVKSGPIPGSDPNYLRRLLSGGRCGAFQLVRPLGGRADEQAAMSALTAIVQVGAERKSHDRRHRSFGLLAPASTIYC